MLPHSKRQRVRPDAVADSDGMFRGLGADDFLSASQDRSPLKVPGVVAGLEKMNPLRFRRMKKDMKWVAEQARKQGISDFPIPDWLR